MKNDQARSMNIAIITMDSLRYDTAQQADTPNLDRLLAGHRTRWHLCYAQGTDTFLSHTAMLKYGHFPVSYDPDAPAYYHPKSGKRIFRVSLGWNRNVPALYDVPAADYAVRGFQAMGYFTAGIGGVGWFDRRFQTSDFWKDVFQHFLWEPGFAESSKGALARQTTAALHTLNAAAGMARPCFFFMNVSVTHNPSFCVSPADRRTQVRAMQMVDAGIMDVIAALPRPCHLFILGDHGSLFADDGVTRAGSPLTGHAFYHPLVMRVPMTDLFLR